MSRRYFAASPAVYESVRSQLDATWGHPDGVTETAFQPVAMAPKDSNGRALLAVWSSFCEMADVAAVLPALLGSGAVAEITAAEFDACQPPSRFP